MFFFENYTVLNVLAFLVILAGLVLINEITRRSKILSVLFYILIPILFTLFLWGKQENENLSGNWFAWVKTYSALAGVIGFMAIRYFKNFKISNGYCYSQVLF